MLTPPPSSPATSSASRPRPNDTGYADNLERVLFNTILAVKPPDSDGDYPYYSTYSPVATKVYYGKKWPCCSGTLVQTVADYPLNLYFQSDDGLYVNGYTPSRLRFTHAGVPMELTQETQYPTEDKITLTLQPASPVAFAVYLRIPAWLTQPATITVNGKAFSIAARPGTYAALHRTWRAGDRIELTLPQSFRTEPIDDLHPETVALMRGPIQYVALIPHLNSTSNVSHCQRVSNRPPHKLSQRTILATRSSSSRCTTFRTRPTPATSARPDPAAYSHDRPHYSQLLD